LPPAIGGQGIRLVDGDEIEGLLFVLCRGISSGLSEPTLFAQDLAVKALWRFAHFKSQIPDSKESMWNLKYVI
jgi:hypothetical protein